MTITITGDTMRLISLFEGVTGTTVKDCVEAPDRLVFVVEEGQISRAIGKGGDNVNRLKQMTKRNIQIIEFSPDSVQFLKNIFRPYNVKGVELEMRNGIKHATVQVDLKEKGKAIGKGGANLRLAREIVSRHHDIKSVSIS